MNKTITFKVTSTPKYTSFLQYLAYDKYVNNNENRIWRRLIEVNGMLNCQGLFYAYRFENYLFIAHDPIKYEHF